MLNPFPIQFLALFAYFILRVITGLLLIYFGYTRLAPAKHAPVSRKLMRTLGLIEIVVGGMLVVGLYTQIAALATMVMSLFFIFWNERFAPILQDRPFYVLLLAISLCLFITGAGAFAFDLPI